MFLKLYRPLVVFDIESTGISPRKDRIIELAAIKVETDGTETEKCWLLNPTVPIPAETTAVHGISDADVKDCPTFADRANEIFEFFRDCDLSGFNADRFDTPCLEEEFARVGMNFAPSTRRHVDVQRIFHRKEPRDLTAAVRFYLDRDHAGAHGAEADTRATLEVLKAQMAKYADLPQDVAAMDEYLVPHDPLEGRRALRQLRKEEGRFAEEADAQRAQFPALDAEGRFRHRSEDDHQRPHGERPPSARPQNAVADERELVFPGSRDADGRSRPRIGRVLASQVAEGHRLYHRRHPALAPSARLVASGGRGVGSDRRPARRRVPDVHARARVFRLEHGEDSQRGRAGGAVRLHHHGLARVHGGAQRPPLGSRSLALPGSRDLRQFDDRSEERRVGKECR